MSHKAFSGIQIKSVELGQVQAVFSTCNVIDSDQDVTLPGAFQDGQELVISAYGHKSWSGELPVGRGSIKVVGMEAILDGQFFMDTEGGADTFRTVKQLGDLGQWSYGYTPVKYSYGEFENQRVRFLEQLSVDEVSPVLVGAGIGTRTLAAKAFAGLRFTDEASAVLAAVKDLKTRALDVMAKRADKGKSLGVESADLIGEVETELKAFAELLTQARPDEPTEQADVQREFLRWARSNTH
jgi:hypothetical protein